MDELGDEIEQRAMIETTSVGDLMVNHHELGITFERHTQEHTLQPLFSIDNHWSYDRYLVFHEQLIFLSTNDIRFIVEELSKLL